MIWLQHILIGLAAGALGYVIGRVIGRRKDRELDRLFRRERMISGRDRD